MIAALTFLLCLFAFAPRAMAQQSSIVNSSLKQPSITAYNILMADSPSICVGGTVPTGGINLNVRTSGETVITEQDRSFQIPFESENAIDTETVFVPAGEYDGASAASLFAVPFSLFNNGVSGNAETANLVVSGALPGATVVSALTCGTAPLINSTYTINETPTSAIVTVGGRVMSWTGRGVARANVSISSATGETRTVQTNMFGYYRFQHVSSGETYVFNVQSKLYTFTPTLVSVNTNLTDLDFTAQQ